MYMYIYIHARIARDGSISAPGLAWVQEAFALFKAEPLQQSLPKITRLVFHRFSLVKLYCTHLFPFLGLGFGKLGEFLFECTDCNCLQFSQFG